MACHNRKAQTMTCLQALLSSAPNVPDVHLRVFLTDDGSTDGTAEAALRLGGNLEIILGSGELYWNRGMALAWETAGKSQPGFDAYLLLNDDTVLDADALLHLIEAARHYDQSAIIVGATRDPETSILTYGGIRRKSSWHPGRTARVPQADAPQEVDTFNANCVLIPRSVYERLGTLDTTFHHSMGDFDYGLRARSAGIKVVVAPGTVGTCSRNNAIGTWRDRKLPLADRLRLLNSPKGLPRREWQTYLRRHGAPLPWLISWLPTLHVLGSSSIAALRRR